MITAILVIIVCGAIGGVVNSLITDNGFFMWKTETVDGRGIWRPGVLGNILIGAVVAFVIWAIYGPLKDLIVVPVSQVQSSVDQIGLTLADLGGALLTGVGGARILTAEVDKRLLKEAATRAARSTRDINAAAQIRTAAPAEVLRIAQKMNQG